MVREESEGPFLEMGAYEVLQGVQFLLSKWECNEIPADTVLALIEVHLEREKELAPGPYVISPLVQEIAGTYGIDPKLLNLEEVPVSTKGQDLKEFQFWEKHLPELIEEFREIMPDSPGLEVMEKGIHFMTEMAGKYIGLLE